MKRRFSDSRTVSSTFETRDQALQWVRTNQEGRRNLTPEEIAYVRGVTYRAADKQQGVRSDLTDVPVEKDDAVPRATSGHSVQKLGQDTAQQLRPHELDVGVMTGQEKVQGQTQDHLKNTLQTAPSFPEVEDLQPLGRQPFANVRIFWNAQETQCKRPGETGGQGMAT